MQCSFNSVFAWSSYKVLFCFKREKSILGRKAKLGLETLCIPQPCTEELHSNCLHRAQAMLQISLTSLQEVSLIVKIVNLHWLIDWFGKSMWCYGCHLCGREKTTCCKVQFSPSTLWVPKTQFKWSGTVKRNRSSSPSLCPADATLMRVKVFLLSSARLLTFKETEGLWMWLL